jgi:hypothetical protein
MSSKKVFVFGAGVDKKLGLPLANQITQELFHFAGNEGTGISKLLRSKDKLNTRFSFKTFINNTISKFINNNEFKNQDFVNEIKKFKDKDDQHTPRIRFFIKLIEHLSEIHRGNIIDEEFSEILKELSANKDDELGDDEGILATIHFDFSDIIKQQLKQLLYEAINGDYASLNDQDKKLYEYIVSKLFNFEKLLSDSFVGFYTGKEADIKRYMYVAWLLWSYMLFKEISVKDLLNSIYDRLDKNSKFITFNYTDFISNSIQKENRIHFHGYNRSYIRLKNREFITPEENNALKNIHSLKDIYSLIQRLPIINNQDKLIPGIIPPIEIKPLISISFLKLWSKAMNWIKEADKIIIIGYSFAFADEHFNDMIRQSARNKKIIIVNPAFKTIIPQLTLIFNCYDNNFHETEIQNKAALKYENLTIINSKAEEIDLNKI